jgi:hypothetical protein
LNRRGALARRTPLRRRRPTPRRSERVYDQDYRAWVRRQPCAARELEGHRCEGPIEGDHAGRRALGRKADDETMIALCQLGHQHRTGFHGCFGGFDQAAMRAWLERQIAAHRARYAARGGR